MQDKPDHQSSSRTMRSTIYWHGNRQHVVRLSFLFSTVRGSKQGRRVNDKQLSVRACPGELPLSHQRLSTAQPLPSSRFLSLFHNTINISLRCLTLPSRRLPPSYHPSSCASCPVDHFALLSTGISPPYISLSKTWPKFVAFSLALYHSQ